MNTVTSAFLGFLFTATLFATCFFTVVGIKLVLITLKSKFKDTSARIEQPKPKRNTVPKPKPKSVSAVKSIEINPDEIDRIYVRKSS